MKGYKTSIKTCKFPISKIGKHLHLPRDRLFMPTVSICLQTSMTKPHITFLKKSKTFIHFPKLFMPTVSIFL